jgi:hypothetical protein
MENLEVGTQCGLVTLTHQEPVVRDGRKRGQWWVGLCQCGNIVGPYTAAHWRKKIRSCKDCKYGNRRSLRKAGTNNTSRCVYNNYRTSAKRRNKEWGLDFDIFLREIIKPCSYCGRIGTNYFNPTNDWEERFEYTGLDRVDSSVGYLESNVVPCCKSCNRAKSDMSVEDFYQWIEGLIQNYRGDYRSPTRRL